MPFKGSLLAVDMLEVLEWLRSTAKTGTLAVECEHFRKQVQVADGRVAGVVSDEPGDALAERLYAAGLLTSEQRDAVRWIEGRTGRSAAEIVKATGAVPDEELARAAEAAAREAILGLFAWPDGAFTFREGETPAGVVLPVEVPLGELLAEGERRRAVAALLRARLPPPEAPLVRAVDACEVATGSPLEEQVLELLAEPRSFLDLMGAAHAGMLELLEVLDRLVAEGAVMAKGAVALPYTRRAAARPRPTSGADDETQVAETIAAPPPPREGAALAPPAAGLLALARQAMEERRYAEALDGFRRAESADPADPRLSVLREGAESVYAEVLYRELRADARPARRVELARLPDGLSPLAGDLFRRADGAALLCELIASCGASELDGLLALRELVQARLVELPAD